VNSLLCLSAERCASLLVAEVRRRQQAYRSAPDGLFTTQDVYPYFERGGEGAKKQRARFKGYAYMVYAVDDDEVRGLYKICHLERMITPP
jgi:hypothetical protein